MKKRISVLVALLVLLGLLLCWQIGALMRTHATRATAADNCFSVSVAAVRGTIYDYQLRPLVNEKKEYVAALAPGGQALSAVQAATTADSFALLRKQMNSGMPAAVRLKEPVALMAGLELFFVPRRFGERLLAPHLIGYLDYGGEHGVSGIELACDKVLSRFSGEATASFPVDGNGRLLSGTSAVRTDTTGRCRGGVVLTLAREIQQLVEDVAAAYVPKGAVVVLEPSSGAIRAMASFPSFQPATVSEEIQKESSALVNRALSGYDCGSVFKIVTMAAALEKGISVETAYTCTGAISVDGQRFHCHNRLGHGTLGLTDAMAQSCNSAFIQLAADTGAAALYSMAGNLGFEQPISLLDSLAATTGVMPTLETLKSSPAAVANLSFGQGYLMASPLHIARTIATVVNGGVMPKLHILEGYVDENGSFSAAEMGRGQTVFSKSTADTLKTMLRRVVTDGTGKKAASSACTVAGKTGTAETGQISGDTPVVQSWFAGYFPAEKPQYVVVVLAEDAQNNGGRSAECFCEISNKLYEYIGE